MLREGDKTVIILGHVHNIRYYTAYVQKFQLSSIYRD